MTIETVSTIDRIERAAPGPWRDALLAHERTRFEHEVLWERVKGHYAAFYDTPEALRGSLDAEVAASVEAIEASVVRQVAARDALWPARDAAIVAEAGRLGREPKVEGEPDWARLMRDLESLRSWRVDCCDGLDVHLPPLLWRNPVQEKKSLFETALRSWGRASGVDLKPVRERVKELAGAGLLPGAIVMRATPAGGVPYDMPFVHVDEAAQAAALEALAGREGMDALAGEVLAAHAALPPERFPMPEEALARLGHVPGMAPGL